MYQFLTNDCSRSTTEHHVSQKLKFMLDSQDPEVVFDLRDLYRQKELTIIIIWSGLDHINVTPLLGVITSASRLLGYTKSISTNALYNRYDIVLQSENAALPKLIFLPMY